MAGAEEGRSFEYTPTWVIALVCFVIVFISVAVGSALTRLGKCFKRKKQEALFGALQKLKEELMLLGFISLLLTVFQGLIGHFCIPLSIANIMLPCKLETENVHHGRRLLAEEALQTCSEGHVPFLSLEALHQLHIFIFVLAVVYVIFCASTMILGGIKIRQWRHWEHSIRREGLDHHHRAHVYLDKFRERAGRYWRKFCVVSWVVAFYKQFYGSVTKSDYLALSSGFIAKHCPGNPGYNFHEFMLRTLEQDFKKIVGISWFLWLFVVIFLLVNIAGWHTYFWLSFLPLILLLIVGAKLEHIIIELASQGTHVRPTDELFWFHRPELVLYLIHFILFQNSFGIAFFLWILSTYGIRSCIMEDMVFIIPRLVVGVIVQLLCSYSTLPLYALVSQMGSNFKQTIFEQSIRELVNRWAEDSKPASMNRLVSDSANSVIVAAHEQQPVNEEQVCDSQIELSRLSVSSTPSLDHC